MTRRELREAVFCLLYMREFHTEEAFPVQMDLYFSGAQNKEFSERDRTYIVSKVNGVLSSVKELDETIASCAEGWRISRLNRVDRSILRLAVYEMFYDDDIPYRVAINEAVELAKKFGSDESPSFINGILGKAASVKGLHSG